MLFVWESLKGFERDIVKFFSQRHQGERASLACIPCRYMGSVPVMMRLDHRSSPDPIIDKCGIDLKQNEVTFPYLSPKPVPTGYLTRLNTVLAVKGSSFVY
ncbi:hypothetical protein TNCV_1585531 [Trichonephila clavipes]|nr:hypothetical protein TNCV_1585531 [Trichonephila clavipes]